MRVAAQLHEEFPDLPAQPTRCKDRLWAVFVDVWNGDTLTEAGAKAGVTHERIRQVVRKVARLVRFEQRTATDATQ